jgi:hypothetical protein
MTPIDYNNPNDPWQHNGYDPYKGLSDEERIKAGCMQVVAFIVMLIVGLAICALFGSCTTTKYVEVEKVRTDTTYITQQQRDSIWLHDSIYMKEWLQGDTIYQLRDRWHTKYIEKLRVDTFLRMKTDSVPVPYPVEKRVEVEKPLTWWQSVRLSFANVMLIGLGIFIAIKVWQYRKKFLP